MIQSKVFGELTLRNFVLLAVLTASANHTFGGLLTTDYGRGFIYGARGGGGLGQLFSEEQFGNSFIMIREASRGGNGIQGGRAKAFVGGTSRLTDGPLRLSALAFSDGGNVLSPDGRAYAEGNWKDVIYLKNTLQGRQRPSELFVEFSVTGQFTTVGLRGAGDFGKIRFEVFSDTDFFHSETDYASIESNFAFAGTGFGQGAGAFYNGFGVNTFGWDAYIFDGENFAATRTVAIPYDSNFGGYDFQIWGMALATKRYDKFLDTDFANSFEIKTIRLSDGTILTDSDLSFDSGLTLSPIQAVPEPASLTLVSLSVVLAVIGNYRKRRTQ